MTWIGLIEGVVAGLVSGAVVSGAFYALSGRDLKREAARLGQVTNLVTLGLESAGIAVFKRNERGEPIGVDVILRGTTGVVRTGAVSGTLTVTAPESDTTKNGEID